MISISRKNLLSEKSKFIISILGVALSILVILAPLGVFYGAIFPARALTEKSGANLWIVQKGSSDLFHTVSILPAGFEKKLEDVKKVISAGYLINHPSRIKIGGKKVTVGVWGFDNENRLAAPWKLFKGTSELKSGEAVVDRSLATVYGIKIGDNIKITSKSFKVVGISLETNVLVFQYIFITNDDAKRIFKQENTVNYYLLKVDKSSISEVKKEAKSIVPNSEIKTKGKIADNNGAVIEDSFLPLITLIALIGLLVGAVVIGLTIYFLTVDKAREYGVLKAIGVQDSKLYWIVFKQSFATSFFGFLAGILFYYLTQQLAFVFLPQINLLLPVQTYGYIFILAVVMGMIASFIPIRKISTLDPAEAFK